MGKSMSMVFRFLNVESAFVVNVNQLVFAVILRAHLPEDLVLNDPDRRNMLSCKQHGHDYNV